MPRQGQMHRRCVMKSLRRWLKKEKVTILRFAIGSIVCIVIYLVAQAFAILLFPHFPTAWTLLPGALLLALAIDYMKGKSRS